jgi:formylmethanofuran dehydrogenase subunit E
MCGADDCKRCNGQNFHNGRYVDSQECSECGEEWVPTDEDIDNEETRCEGCRK